MYIFLLNALYGIKREAIAKREVSRSAGTVKTLLSLLSDFLLLLYNKYKTIHYYYISKKILHIN